MKCVRVITAVAIAKRHVSPNKKCLEGFLSEIDVAFRQVGRGFLVNDETKNRLWEAVLTKLRVCLKGFLERSNDFIHIIKCTEPEEIR